MNDRQSAAIILGMFTVAFILWYRKRSESQRTALFGGSGTVSAGAAPSATGGVVPRLPNATGIDPNLILFARKWGLEITSGMGGQHNPGSAHYQGRAIDVRSRGMTDAVVGKIRELAATMGIRLFDERMHPAGQKVWGGPHLHLEVPRK